MKYFSHFKMNAYQVPYTEHKSAFNSDNTNILLSVYLADSSFSGDMHKDAFKLMELESLINYLKSKGLVQNASTQVRFDNSFKPEYKECQLNYKETEFGAIKNKSTTNAVINVVTLNKNSIILNIQNYSKSLMSLLDKELQEELKLKNCSTETQNKNLKV